MKITKDRLIQDVYKKEYKEYPSESVARMLRVKNKVNLNIRMPKDIIIIRDDEDVFFSVTSNHKKVTKMTLSIPHKRDTAGYYSIIFHELIHSTQIHFNRPPGNMGYYWGILDYCKEELVAEMGNLLILDHFDILNIRLYIYSLNYIRNYGEYLFEELPHDKRDEILDFAFEQAERAKDYLLQQII